MVLVVVVVAVVVAAVVVVVVVVDVHAFEVDVHASEVDVHAFVGRDVGMGVCTVITLGVDPPHPVPASVAPIFLRR
jgi:hypothetical protein